MIKPKRITLLIFTLLAFATGCSTGKDTVIAKTQVQQTQRRYKTDITRKPVVVYASSSRNSSENLKNKNPSIMFMIAEQNIGEEHLVYWWKWLGNRSYYWRGGEFNYTAFAKQFNLSITETTLTDEFINHGLDVVDISKAQKGKIKVSNVYKYVNLKKDVMMELGKNCGADIVVKGKAIVKKQPTSGRVGSYLADITVKAIRVEDGRVLGAARGHGTARHISDITGGSKALEQASLKIAEKLIDQIMVNR